MPQQELGLRVGSSGTRMVSADLEYGGGGVKRYLLLSLKMGVAIVLSNMST